MKKTLLSLLLFAATSLFAVEPETRVENFTPKDGSGTSTYVTTETTKECQQASWTFFSGGIRNDVGNFGSFAAVIRGKKSGETKYAYLQSSTIEGGIDSLWFTWNSNGNETKGHWDIKIYINETLVGNINEPGNAKIAAGGPFNKFNVGNLGIEGDFTIKFVNNSLPDDTSANYMRFVIDDLSWRTNPAAGEKATPEFEYAEESLIKKIDVIAFSNPLTNTSDGTPTFESSNPAVATVAENGSVTIVGEGTTVITASVAETENYKAAEASYTLRVVPLNFNRETFDGANNVDLATNNTYLTTPTSSFEPSTATGLKWTTLLGSVRNSLGGSSATNLAAVVRAKKNAEENYGYLLSDSIEGGIDHLAFEWNANGTEASREKPWNIKIYINDDSIGAITSAGAAVQPMGSWFKFEASDLKIDGKFVIKIVNYNVPDNGTDNQYRWVMDNLEWYSYEAPCEPNYGILVDGTDYIAGVKNDAQTEWLEYAITADLDKDETFVFADHCSGDTFMAGQDNGEGNYLFNYTEGNAAFVAPATGTYTIYLKMYGMDDNWIWTVYKAPKFEVTIADPTNGTLAVKNGENEVESGDSIAAQTVLTIIPTPAEGYQIATVTVNGQELTPQEDVYTFTMGYEDIEVAATFEEVCVPNYGILVNGTDYIAGIYNELQPDYLEYVITADLSKDETFVFAEHCSGDTFMAGQDNGEGNYLFNYTEGNTAFVAPETGTYTIYLKMYGPDNNWIWTEFEAAHTAIENTNIKADVRKAIEEGMVIIYRNGKRYNLTGAEMR